MKSAAARFQAFSLASAILLDHDEFGATAKAVFAKKVNVTHVITVQTLTHSFEVAISLLTIAELRRGIESKPHGKARRSLEREFGCVMEFFEDAVWLFDEAAAFEWGRLMAEARGHPLPFDDSLIAAIARSMSATVVTRNLRHFPGCRTLDPWTGKESAAWRPSA